MEKVCVCVCVCVRVCVYSYCEIWLKINSIAGSSKIYTYDVIVPHDFHCYLELHNI